MQTPNDPAKWTRRDVLRQAAISAVGLAFAPRGAQASDAQPKILFNILGYCPQNAKRLLFPASTKARVVVVNEATQQIELQVEATPVRGDMGSFAAVDVSQLKDNGQYIVRAGVTSANIRVHADAHLQAIAAGVHYFARQRCGDEHKGYNSPCHLDDGKRNDDGRHRDVRGGWHDACDLRKWVDATIYGVIGLTQAMETLAEKHPDRDAAIDEIRWGNQYFLKMQEPEGYVMRWCGGDEGNRHTDNRVGSDDDRVIDTEPCELPGQFSFIAAEARVARLLAGSDKEYSHQCLHAAERCLKWCLESRSPGTSLSLAAGVIASTQLYAATEVQSHATTAARYADELLALQAADASGAELGGYFRSGKDNPEPFRDIHHGNLPLLAMCELLEQFPGHSNANRWKSSLERHVEHLAAMATRSPFGIVPYGLYSGADAEQGRVIGAMHYRWFMKPKGEYPAADWWVGINAHLAASAIGLVRAGSLLDLRHLRSIAQRHLDWLLGVNPFSASTITGFGANPPALYRGTQFSPPTPEIRGGVMNGIGGDESGNPVLDAGSWQTCEYWTPAVAYTHLLLAILMC